MPNGSAMASRAGKETFRFQRFGGVRKYAQAIKYSTLCPIYYSLCWQQLFSSRVSQILSF